MPVVIVVGLFLFITRDDGGAANTEGELQEVLSTAEDKTEKDNPQEIEFVVDVKGEVVNPGVYEMSAESRVNDVIQKAGGFTGDADQTQVNLAQKVHDEMIIVISKTGEEGEVVTGGTNDSSKVRLNIADQTEIESLNGIGPSKAAAIIQYREENGLFQTADDLLDISGIGKKTLDNIKDDLIIP